MGLLDNLGGMLGNNDAAMGGILKEVLGQSGGLDGLMAKFNQAGLGDLISGWVSTGPNPAVQPGQLEQALGSDAIRDLATRFGVNTNDLLGSLSNILPQAVDSMTPDGKIPPQLQQNDILGGLLGQVLGGLK
jgi:uncharacterized protein YidB (DUF937 family)